MIRIAALYPNVDGSHFDGSYYAGPHTALACKLLASQGRQAFTLAPASILASMGASMVRGMARLPSKANTSAIHSIGKR